MTHTDILVFSTIVFILWYLRYDTNTFAVLVDSFIIAADPSINGVLF